MKKMYRVLLLAVLGLGYLGALQAQAQFSVATFHNKTTCGNGSFFDPRNGGECWSCPGGFGRSAEPVTHDRACQKAILVGPFSKATFQGKVGKCEGKGRFFG